MIKIWMISFIFMIFFPLSSQSLLDEELIYKNVSNSIVLIQANNLKNEPISKGTGFFLGEKSCIITSFHVINGSQNINVTTSKGYTYPIKRVLAYDISSDLACLSTDIPQESIIPLKINISSQEIGKDIAVIGYPDIPKSAGEIEPLIVSGTVSGILFFPDYGGETILTDASISPGYSGSPLINDQEEVIGVAIDSYVSGLKLDFAVSCKQVLELAQIASVSDGTPISEWNLTSYEELYAIGMNLLRNGKYNESIYYFNNAIKFNSTYAEGWMGKGFALAGEGNYYDAIHAYNISLNINPRLITALFGKGNAFYNLGQYEGYFKGIDNIINLCIEETNASGLKWLAAGDDPKIRSESKQRTIAMFQVVVLAMVDCLIRADELYQKGKYNDSIFAFDMIIRFDPKDAEAWHKKGISLQKVGRIVEAIEALAKAEELGYLNKSLQMDDESSNATSKLIEWNRELDAELSELESGKSLSLAIPVIFQMGFIDPTFRTFTS